MVPCFIFDRWAPKMTVRTQTIAFAWHSYW